ncbi:MAG: recombinase RecT [Ruminococcus sp.]|nr:recombinase RecT [Ruminococcus sp.]
MENTEVKQEIQITNQQNANEISEKIHQPAANIVADFSRAYKLAQVISTADIIPDSYKNKPADCAIAVDMANRMGVSPLMVMQSLYVVKGKPSWSGQACKALIDGCGKFRQGSVRPVYFGEKGTDSRGCMLVGIWSDTGDKVEGPEVTLKMAKSEGWLSKNPKWTNMPELMLAYRASAFFARVYCPEVLMGVHVEGEVEDIRPAERVNL